jgi:archaellum biogenesis ATPase FlaH
VTNYAVKWLRAAIKDDIISLPEKDKLNGYTNRPEVWEAMESVRLAHQQGGAKGAAQAWNEQVARVIPDIAEIVNQPRMIHHISEFENEPPIEWLVKNEIPKHSLTVIYGSSGAGKSFAAIDYAAEIAMKENIIYVAAEGLSGYYARYAAWLKHNGHKKPGKFNLFPKSLQILKPEDVDRFIEEASDYKPAVVIIDTLSRCMVGGDENNQKDMGLFVYGCERIQRALDCTVIIVHHTGKTGDNERGSSVLRAAADMMIAVSNEEGLVKIACGKSKDTKPFMHRYCRLLEVEITQNGQKVVSCVLEAWQHVKVSVNELTPNQARLLECLASNLFQEGVRAPDLKGYSNIQGSSFYSALNSLIKKGYARKMGKGAKIDPVVITSQGMIWIQEKSRFNPEEMSA